jgi:hypothetical protein
MKKSSTSTSGTGACAACRFFKEIDEGGGACRRFPPTVMRADETGVQVQFPITRADMGCGEFAARS